MSKRWRVASLYLLLFGIVPLAWAATKLRNATIINSTLDSSPVGGTTPSTGVFSSLSDTGLSSGNCIQVGTGGLFTALPGCPNGGRCSTASSNCSGSVGVCSTGAGGGSTCTTTVPLFRTEADTNYAATPGCIGPSQFPIGVAITTKSTSSVTIQLTNGTNNEAQISTCAELDVTTTR